MKYLREADAWAVARANRENAEHQQKQETDSQTMKSNRRELNRRLAEKLVAGWSAYEYRKKFDDELALALDGKHDGSFDVNAAKYTRRIKVQPQSLGGDANGAAAATEQRTRQRMASFHSIRWNGETK